MEDKQNVFISSISLKESLYKIYDPNEEYTLMVAEELILDN